MPPVVNRTAYLEINSVPLATPAWRILSLAPLYGMETRGSNRTLPGVDGEVPYRRRLTTRTVVLKLLVFGRFQSDGTLNANALTGLEANIDYLYTNVLAPVATTAGTRAAVWHRFDGGTKTADVHIESFDESGWGRDWVKFDLELSIPSGRFA